jgi:hypothetical protein
MNSNVLAPLEATRRALAAAPVQQTDMDEVLQMIVTGAPTATEDA